jgi:hypothetical protein
VARTLAAGTPFVEGASVVAKAEVIASVGTEGEEAGWVGRSRVRSNALSGELIWQDASTRAGGKPPTLATRSKTSLEDSLSASGLKAGRKRESEDGESTH